MITNSSENSILASISLTTLLCGSYITWPSVWNIPAHLGLIFSLIAYCIPLLGLGILDKFPESISNLYVNILLLGAASYIVGLFIGREFPRMKFIKIQGFNQLNATQLNILETTIIGFTSIGAIGMIICFYLMGFIPAFSEDPMSAKFFRGIYHAAYQPYSFIYRCSLFMVISTQIFLISLLYDKMKPRIFILLAISLTLLCLTLMREPLMLAVLISIGIYCASKNKSMILYLIFLLISYSSGSIIYYIIYDYTHLSSNEKTYNMISLFNIISGGTPDVSDHMTFLREFSKNEIFSYGRTFTGGLFSSNYYWHPGIYTLNVINRTTDVSDIASGGFRLPVAMWGYTAFGWFGVFLVPCLSGFLTGAAQKSLKNFISQFKDTSRIPLTTFSFAYFYYFSFCDFFIHFYLILAYNLPALFLSRYLTWKISKYGSTNENRNKK